jgi:antitoxin CptB
LVAQRISLENGSVAEQSRMSPSRTRPATSLSGSGFSVFSTSLSMAICAPPWSGSSWLRKRCLAPLGSSPERAYIRSLPVMDEARVKRLRFRAWRRGFREADLILGPFADSHARSLTESELEAFERLLDRPDHDVYGWIVMGGEAPTGDEAALVLRIRAFLAPENTSGAERA